MVGIHRSRSVAVLLFLISSLLLTLGGGGEDTYTSQVICAQYNIQGTSCSENITKFMTNNADIETFSLTFNSSAIELNGSRDCEVFLESSCSIEEISLRDSCECMISTKYNTIDFSCGRAGIQGSLRTARVVQFTHMDLLPDGYTGGSNVFGIVQLGEVTVALPSNANCSLSDSFDECLTLCSENTQTSNSFCVDRFCDNFIAGFCDTDCTTGDVETLLQCQSLCSEDFCGALDSTCSQNPCAGSFNRNCDSEIGTRNSDRIILNQCLSPCLQQPDITCSGAVCRYLLDNCERSPLYRQQCNEDEDLPLCRMLCRRDGTVNSLVNQQCSDEYSMFQVFCAEEFSATGECGDLLLFDIDCDEHRATCELICSGDVRNLDRQCGPQVQPFCGMFLQGLLNRGADFNISNVNAAIAVQLKTTITSELSEALTGMQFLFSYFDAFPMETRNFVASEVDAVEELVAMLEDLFDSDRRDEWNNHLMEDGIGSSQALQNAENLARIIGQSMVQAASNGSFAFGGQNVVMYVARPSLANTEGGVYMFPSSNVFNSSTLSGARKELPIQLLCEDGIIEGCPAVVASMLINDLAVYLDNSVPEDNEIVNSFLLSTQLFGVPSNLSGAILDNPIKFIFTPLVINEYADLNSSKCVFWDFNSSQWSSEGISTEIVNSSVLCLATHLTSFAVLFPVTTVGNIVRTPEAVALQAVTYVGCAVSIVSLILTIILFLVYRSVITRKSLNKEALLYIHLNLAIALLVAMVIFVAGIETATPVPWLCITIAALLHYFFLCVFCWMLAEGIMLYLLIVRGFGRAPEKWYYLLVLGWGLPVPIVSISVGILRDDYRTDNYCWIKATPTSAAIWTFVVPMAIIILVNSVILVMAVVSMVRGRMHGGAEQSIKTRELVKSTLKATIILLPLLGLTWVMGLFVVNEDTQVFAWLFTIINSLQGFFILVFHVLRNEVVLDKLRRCGRRIIRTVKTRKDYKSSTIANTVETALDSKAMHMTDMGCSSGKEELNGKSTDEGVNGVHSCDSANDS